MPPLQAFGSGGPKARQTAPLITGAEYNCSSDKLIIYNSAL